MTTQPVSRWLAPYLGLVLLWGSSFAFIAVGLQSFTPLGVSAGRMVLGGGTLLIICAITRTALPPRELWPRLAVTALLATVLPWSLTALAQTYITSSIAAIMSGTAPLLTLLVILVFFREERPTLDRIVGLAIGLAGVLIVVGVWQGMGASTWLGIGAALAANCAFAVSLPYTHRHLTGGVNSSRLSPLSLATGMFIFAAIETLPFALMAGPVKTTVVLPSVLAMLALGCLCSGIAYLLNYRIIQLTDATTASTVLYVMPLVAVLLGTLFLGEQVSWNEPMGGVVILLGAALAQGLLRIPTRGAQR
ncbi:MAG: DMT family transporter [Candidatus Nanopelagicales bacterium]